MIDISKDEFIKIVKSSLTMAEAARKMNLHFNTFVKYAKMYECYNPNPGGKGMHKVSFNRYKLEDILSGKYPEYQTYKLKNRLLLEGIKENKCEICGIIEWNGNPISMELHHIDGNRFNHSLENLQMLCPNCHSQTETFRAKNLKNK